MMGTWRIGSILCVVAWFFCGASVFAQSAYPTKSIRLIVPYPPGGGADVMGRVVADALSTRFAQQVVVDNRGGASTTIGADLAAKSPADGYTLFLATVTTLAVVPNVRSKLPYDFERDFSPVSTLAKQPYVLASTTLQRTALLPEVPTMRESGVDMVVVVWYSLHAPAATPREIVMKIAEAVVKATQSVEMRQRPTDLGAEPLGYMPEEAAKFLRDEIALWATVVKASGAQAD